MANTDTLLREAIWMMNDLPPSFLRAEEDGHGHTLPPPLRRGRRCPWPQTSFIRVLGQVAKRKEGDHGNTLHSSRRSGQEAVANPPILWLESWCRVKPVIPLYLDREENDHGRILPLPSSFREGEEDDNGNRVSFTVSLLRKQVAMSYPSLTLSPY